MSILDRVYTTFNRLDQDFARSKKTRSEFIADKFGGDINTGAIIILDAIRAEGVEETPENIAKVSFIKDTFARIQECADHLDALSSFSFADSDVIGNFLDILCSSENHCSRQNLVTQSQLWAGKQKAVHYVCNTDGVAYADPDSCSVFHVFNENMVGLLSGLFKADDGVHMNCYYKVLPGRRLKLIQEGAVAKNLK